MATEPAWGWVTLLNSAPIALCSAQHVCAKVKTYVLPNARPRTIGYPMVSATIGQRTYAGALGDNGTAWRCYAFQNAMRIHDIKV